MSAGAVGRCLAGVRQMSAGAVGRCSAGPRQMSAGAVGRPQFSISSHRRVAVQWICSTAESPATSQHHHVFCSYHRDSVDRLSSKLKNIEVITALGDSGHRNPGLEVSETHLEKVENFGLVLLICYLGYRKRPPSFSYRKPPITLPKIFAFNSFLNRKPVCLDQEASTSQEGRQNSPRNLDI
ncbi:uncharacterized protein LOC133731331 [Rosa rugosa]|uniref:uncharacterized protein LOC133731331 n=1 Tax=Rosa rugosa TaxID=74645 RepID=UPI002B402085|nr:uncharacterized protein LOC133731331 [Rosa rugosa]